MENSELEHLLNRIIRQEEYAGDVCPTERNLVRFIMGALSPAEQQQMKQHLSVCRSCSEIISKLDSAKTWFLENQLLILEGFFRKAARSDVRPWAACLSAPLVEKYAAGAVPETPSGMLFRKRVESHLNQCPACRRAVSESRSGLREPFVMKLEEIRDRITESLAGTLRQFLLNIQTVAVAQGVGYGVRAMPGYRSQPVSSLDALLLDDSGKIILDAQGNSRTVRFDLIRAQLERDGHFVIDLSTADRNVWETAAARFIVHAALHYENRKIVLPSEKIYSDGRVTFVGNLVSGVEISTLPLSTIELTVTSALNPPAHK